MSPEKETAAPEEAAVDRGTHESTSLGRTDRTIPCLGSIVKLVIARADHVPIIAARMRRADRDEVRASGGYTPEEALRASLAASEFARTAFVDGEPLAMFGVVAKEAMAFPWLLTTDAVCRHPMLFYRASKVIVREIREAYPMLLQAIHKDHAAALSWIKRLGFTVGEPEPFGQRGELFCPVVLRTP